MVEQLHRVFSGDLHFMCCTCKRQSLLARCAGFSLSKTEAQNTLRPVARYTHLATHTKKEVA